jgi:hypothetical protein
LHNVLDALADARQALDTHFIEDKCLTANRTTWSAIPDEHDAVGLTPALNWNKPLLEACKLLPFPR